MSEQKFKGVLAVPLVLYLPESQEYHCYPASQEMTIEVADDTDVIDQEFVDDAIRCMESITKKAKRVNVKVWSKSDAQRDVRKDKEMMRVIFYRRPGGSSYMDLAYSGGLSKDNISRMLGEMTDDIMADLEVDGGMLQKSQFRLYMKNTGILSFKVAKPKYDRDKEGELLELSQFGEYCPANSLRGYSLTELLKHPENYHIHQVFDRGEVNEFFYKTN